MYIYIVISQINFGFFLAFFIFIARYYQCMDLRDEAVYQGSCRDPFIFFHIALVFGQQVFVYWNYRQSP